MGIKKSEVVHTKDNSPEDVFSPKYQIHFNAEDTLDEKVLSLNNFM